MKLARLTTLGAVAAVTALALSGCAGGGDSGSGDAGGGGSETAVMYSSNNETVIGVVVDAAGAQDPSLKVEAVTGSSGPLLERIKAEAGKNSADVFYSAPAATFQDFLDVIEPYDSPEAAAIPEELIDPEHRWTATNTHVVALMANTDQIEGGKAPTTWKELTDPKWQGKLISADPEQSSTALTALYGAYKVLGEADFAKLAANIDVSESSGNVYPAVANGEYAVSIGYESNIYPYIAGGQAGVEMVYPKDGTFVEHDAVIVIKDAAHPEAAKRLVDTILSKSTQEELLVQSFRRPTRSDIDPSEFVDFPRLEDLKVVDIHGDEDAQGRTDFLEFWKTVS